MQSRFAPAQRPHFAAPERLARSAAARALVAHGPNRDSDLMLPGLVCVFLPETQYDHLFQTGVVSVRTDRIGVAHSQLPADGLSLEVAAGAAKGQITRAFKKMLKSKSTNKKLLSSFVEQIA